jgi:hypothetical protein
MPSRDVLRRQGLVKRSYAARKASFAASKVGTAPFHTRSSLLRTKGWSLLKVVNIDQTAAESGLYYFVQILI